MKIKFQKIIALLLSGTIALSTSGYSVFAYQEEPSENLVINGSFEKQFGELGEKWDGYWSPAIVEIKNTTDEFPAQDGEKYAEIRGRNAQSICLRQIIPLTAGIPYTVSAYLRIPESNGHDMKIYVASKGEENLNDLTKTSVTAEWTRLSAIYTPKKDGNYGFLFIDVPDNPSKITPKYHFDNFVVTSDYINSATITINGEDEITEGNCEVNSLYSITVKNGSKTIEGSYSVKWSIDSDFENEGVSIDENTGELTVKPDFLGENSEKTITIKAEVDDFGISREVTKDVIVKEYITAQQRVENQLALMQDETFVTSEDKFSVEGNLNLITSGDYGTKITWLSDSPDIINNEGILLSEDGKAHTVTLTATVSYSSDGDEYSDTKEFTVTTAQTGENLVINGNFESKFADGRNSINRGETLGEWFANWAYVTRETLQPFKGKYSTKISQRSAQYQGLEQEVSLKGGIPYTVSAYLRIPESTGHKMKIYAQEKDIDGKNDLVFENVGDEWKKLSASFTPVSDGNFKFRFIDESTTNVVSEYYFDNFTVSSDYIKNSLATVNGPDYLIMNETGDKSEEYSVSLKSAEGIEYPKVYKIKWSLDEKSLENGAVIDNETGIITIPEDFLGEKSSENIVVTATTEDFGFSKSVKKTVEVKAYVSPMKIILQEISALNENEDIIGDSGNTSAENITENLDLNKTGRFGAKISWTSSKPEIITNDGVLKVTDAQWHRVIMTATVSYNGLSETREFNLIVQGRYDLVLNGDFEESFNGKNVIEKNTSNGPWYANWATAERVEGDAQSGNYYVKITGRTTRSQGLEQTVKLKAGRIYTISAWVRMPEGSEEHSLILSSDNNGTAMANVLADANEWKQLTATKVCSADEDFTIKIFDSTNTYASSFFIDNYSVTCNMMKSVGIEGFDTVRKPLNGTKSRTYELKAFDTEGKEINVTDIEWFAEDMPQGVNFDQNTLNVNHNAENGEIHLRAMVEYDGVILSARKTILVLDYLDEKAIVKKAKEKLDWNSISSGQKKENVTENLNLPESVSVDYDGETYTVNVLWVSTDEKALNTSGNVQRSAFETAELVLKAQITLGEEEENVIYNLTVPKLLNLADNPGFESNGEKWSGGEITSEKNHSGSYSLFSENSPVIMENDYMRDGHIYYIEGYVLTETDSELFVAEKTSGKKIIEGIKTKSGKWLKFSKDFVMKSDEKAWFEFEAKSSCYFDDILIRDITDEYNNALNLTIKAETLKTREAAENAKSEAGLLPDCDRKNALLSRIESIKIKSSSSTGGGGGGGGAKSYAASIVKNESYDKAMKTAHFSDISGHWAENDVNFLFENGIINGKSADLYAPEEKVTRAELATLAVRILKLATGENIIFKDVDSNKWYADAVCAAAAHSIIKGDGEFFRPEENVTREEAAVILMRTYRAAGKNNTVSILNFSDSIDIASWASEDIGYAVGLGIIKGMDNETFAPKAQLTRAQAATVIRRIFDLINN